MDLNLLIAICILAPVTILQCLCICRFHHDLSNLTDTVEILNLKMTLHASEQTFINPIFAENPPAILVAIPEEESNDPDEEST